MTGSTKGGIPLQEKYDDIETPVFILERLPVGDAVFCRLKCPDWINVIPLTRDGDVIFVRQYRHGTDEETLEIPGGQMDPDDRDPLAAAVRELREETGYGKGEWTTLGWVHPNPAILTNRCHLFLAEGVEEVGEICNDAHEHTIVERFPLQDVPELVLSGRITHGLVINAFSALALTRPGLFPWRINSETPVKE
ncbi:MAG TPA: NUDIX hydrolase [Thermoanaerobaculia bacterium]|nr:NUDIX hydrolase [Thermoanaerobaculia bacterium]HUM29872.1 NUDIX hydrolase [Thermoanaerobaculia bacterium]HXK68147.1 NUDIX hydrolase [Thermoanaerobaculia bacterium]